MQGEPDGGHGGLADLRLHEPALGLGAAACRIQIRTERAAQRGVQLRAEGLVEAVQGLAESRDLLVQLAQQPDLLGALPREEQRQPALGERPLGERDARRDVHGPVRLGLGVGRGRGHLRLPRFERGRGRLEAVAELRERLRRDGQARGAVGASGERARHVRGGRAFLLEPRERPCQLARMSRDQPRPRSRDEEQLGAALRRPCAPGEHLLRARGLLQHHVRVGPAESERADRRAAGMAVARFPGGRGARQEERTVAQPQLRVLLGHRGLRRKRAVVQGQGGLDQPGHAGGGHGVADVRLHRAERGARAVAGRPALLAEQLRQRAHLDDVAHGGGRPVRLDVADRLRRDAGVLVGQAERLELAALPGRHRAFAAAVTNPSALASNGRHSPVREIAPMREKLTRLSGSRLR